MYKVQQSIENIKKNFGTFEEFQLFLRILILIPIVEVSVKLFSIPRLMNLITPKKTKHNGKLNENYIIVKAKKYTDFLLGLNFWIYKPKCLKRSLVLYRVLREAGLDIHICFGVRFNGENEDSSPHNALEGHAWLIKDGDIFLEKNEEIARTYKMTYCFPNSNVETLDTIP
jgi:hypothetical protein